MIQEVYNKQKGAEKWEIERERKRERKGEKERLNKERQTFISNEMQVRIVFCLCIYQGVDYK